jgi:hypothetical protein
MHRQENLYQLPPQLLAQGRTVPSLQSVGHWLFDM